VVTLKFQKKTAPPDQFLQSHLNSSIRMSIVCWASREWSPFPTEFTHTLTHVCGVRGAIVLAPSPCMRWHVFLISYLMLFSIFIYLCLHVVQAKLSLFIIPKFPFFLCSEMQLLSISNSLIFLFFKQKKEKERKTCCVSVKSSKCACYYG
jgi:hypothetical protein